MMRIVIGMGVLLAAPDVRGESLEMNGTTYPSSCDEAAWEPLAKELRDAAGKRDPMELESLLQAYLCGSDARAAAIILRAAPVNVTLTTEGTGEPTTRRRVQSREALEPRGGRAWNATVQSDRSDVGVTFFTNEACVRSITFRPVKAGWRVRAAGEACD